jgi:hypothetical protein
MSTKKFIPYTYVLFWEDGTKYYGVRYAQGCHPSDLLVSYFSSSKYVKEKIKLCGLPYAKIHKTFPGDKESAILYENRALKILKCAERYDYLNRTYNKAIPAEHNGSSKVKGKTYEEIYGKEKAALLRAMRAKSTKERNKIKWSDESKNKWSLATTGSGNNRAKRVYVFFDNLDLEFSTLNEAADYLASKTGFKPTTCISAIRSKLYSNGTTNRKKFKPLYSAFECKV